MGRINIFKFIALSLFVVSVLVSCNEPEKRQTEVKLSSDIVDVPAEGGAITVDYTVSNPTEDAYWSVPSEGELEWISDFDFSEGGKIKFNVDPNESGTQREEEVVLEYSAIPGRTFSCLVRQQGSSDTEPFTVEMIEVNYVDATARITPTDPEMTYLSMVYEEDYFQTMGNDDQIVETIINELSFIAGMGGMSVEDFISKYYLMTGTGEYYYDMLYLGDTHCIYVVGLSEDLQRTSKGVTEFFTTKSVELTNTSFELEATVNGPFVSINVIPSDDNIRYWPSICLKSDYDGNIQNGINYEVWKGSVSGLTKEEVLEKITKKGSYTIDTTLQNNTEYIAFAAEINSEGLVCSEPYTVEFTTGDVPMSDLTFDMSVKNLKVSTAELEIIPSNNTDSYSFGVIPATEYAGMSDEEILDKYLENNVFQALLLNRVGPVESYLYESLLPDTEYYLIAFGFFQEVVTAPLQKISFKTPTPEKDFESFEVEISIAEVSDNSITASFSPSSESILYFNGTCPAGATEESIRADVEETINRWIEGGYAGVTCPLDFYLLYGFRGIYEYKYTGLGEYDEYQIFAVAVSENEDTEGQLASTMYFSEVVTLLDEDPENAPVQERRSSSIITLPEIDLERHSASQKSLSSSMNKWAVDKDKISQDMPSFRLGKPVNGR